MPISSKRLRFVVRDLVVIRDGGGGGGCMKLKNEQRINAPATSALKVVKADMALNMS